MTSAAWRRACSNIVENHHFVGIRHIQESLPAFDDGVA